ncbi:MAG: hypothetical protein FDX21_08765 [Chlorobium sp.]|nr:MAG: hypothetical protein FDX21_08765 [Chlorobium sp.]
MSPIQLIASYVGVFLGAVLLLATVYGYIKQNNFGLGGTVLSLLGLTLIGLSFWSSFEFSVDAKGKVAVSYTQSQSEASKAADLNGQLQKLKFQVDMLSQDISDLKRATPSAKIFDDAALKRAAKTQAFNQNSLYSILVFNKENQQNTASSLVNTLLAEGFKSAAASTDLKEAKKQFDPNHAWVIYSSRGKEKLSELKNMLRDKYPGITCHVEPKESELRNGDIQVLLY